MNCRIFIADDSELLRSRLVEMLSQIKEIEIIGQAKNPPEAIESIIELKPDVLILDILKPGKNGFKVLEAIKKRNLSTKVIVFTNYSYPKYRKRCKDAGADYFFDKLKEFEKLINTLKQLTHSHNKTEKTE